MSKLSVTLIDVGWGDSILIESETDSGDKHYALVDSNDDEFMHSSYIHLERFFEEERIPGARRRTRLGGRRFATGREGQPLFDLVLLTHDHTDHGTGLERIMYDFGTRLFIYPKEHRARLLATLQNFANQHTDKVLHHEAVNIDKQIPDLGDVKVDVLWPPYNTIDEDNENNNSVVLSMTLGRVAFILTGDATTDVWPQIADRIPQETRFFKMPHHGGKDGLFRGKKTPWLTQCPAGALIGISSHVHPHPHPNEKVIQKLDSEGWEYYRTDQHYHLTFSTNGVDIRAKYSHM